MPLFGPPDIKKLRARRDVRGLVAALGYRKDPQVRTTAAAVLGELADGGAVDPLIAALSLNFAPYEPNREQSR